MPTCAETVDDTGESWMYADEVDWDYPKIRESLMHFERSDSIAKAEKERARVIEIAMAAHEFEGYGFVPDFNTYVEEKIQ